jgi:hypothetical protein
MKNIAMPLLALSLGLSACGQVGRPAQSIAQTSLAAVGCKVSQSEMWSALQAQAEEQSEFPAPSELKSALEEVGAKRGLKGPSFERYVDAFVENYRATVDGIRSNFAPQDEGSWKKALAEMEVGVRVTNLHAKLASDIETSLSRLEAAEKDLNAECTQPAPSVSNPAPVENGSASAQAGAAPEDAPAGNRGPAGELDPATGERVFKTVWDQLLASGQPELYGMHKSIAVAYQSCDVLKAPPMTASSRALAGIEVIGKHPAGGLRRRISDLSKVQSSHYYIAGRLPAKNSCFKVRETPLIYDFGGKPATSSKNEQVLDMFRNAGTGEAVLGIDCSAFVFSALATAGLKMDPNPNKVLKASLVHGIGSRAFKEPQDNGLRCLQKITVSRNASVKTGDVVAINGHVVMLDEVGADPFGLNKIKSAEDCNSSKISANNFDFVVAQSSPSKNAVGINRFEARDYLATSSTYREGMVRYAVAACRAKFGLDPKLNSPDLSVVRHKKTPECMAQELVLSREECVDSCKPL